MRALLYALPGLGIAIIFAPAVSVLGGLYAKYHEFTLSEIGAVILIARIFDALTDPILAGFSDHQKRKTASRKKLILAGFIVFAISAFFLYDPPFTPSLILFTLFYLIFYLGHTALMIPYQAWGNEFTSNREETLAAYTFLTLFGQMGSLLFFAIPMLPIWQNGGVTPSVLVFAVVAGASVGATSLVLAVTYVPSEAAGSHMELPPSDGTDTSIFRKMDNSRISGPLSDLLMNKPFLIFSVSLLFFGVGIGMWQGLFFIFVDVFMEMGDLYPKIAVIGAIAGMCSVPLWFSIVKKIGKKKSWLLSMFVLGVSYSSLLWADPGNPSYLLLTIANIGVSICLASLGVITLSITADISDYGTLKCGVERNALYFGAQALLAKVNFAVGGGAGLAIAGILGFDPRAATQNADGARALMIAIAAAPIMFTVFAAITISYFKLSEQHASIIRRRISMARTGLR